MKNPDIHFLNLARFIKERCDAPDWEKMVFVENRDIKYEPSSEIWGGYIVVSQNSLKSIDEYRERFWALLGQGYSWINLNAAGIFHENLLVIVEVPNQKHTTPRNKVSVNLSGPSLKNGVPQWDIRKKVSIISN